MMKNYDKKRAAPLSKNHLVLPSNGSGLGWPPTLKTYNAQTLDKDEPVRLCYQTPHITTNYEHTAEIMLPFHELSSLSCLKTYFLTTVSLVLQYYSYCISGN